MSQELKKSYDPKEVEAKWYALWEKSGFFSADPHSTKPPFCIIMPPPNITGALHMGHALDSTLQDIQIRYKRMRGFETLWIPGTDHAGISTQTVVEKFLLAKYGLSRHEISREDFLQHIWKWKEEKEKQILLQIQKLGCSCDWSRLRFTMDKKSNHAVRTIFKRLFDANLIYRGDYLVNWDPVTQTALADDEVEYEDRPSSLWYLRYPLANGEDYIVVATTRPETMLGDTAVAVSPKDPRFLSLIGKEIILPLVGRKIPIIADPFVDPTFGTGAVKITPAHDFNDYDIGIRHQLSIINIMTSDGRIIDDYPEFAGMTMLDARQAVINKLKELDLIEKEEPHMLRVGISYRSKAVIEPFLSKQWFLKMTAFKQILIDAVTKEKVSFIPPSWISIYLHWIHNLRDWCISRQLWWGHRIPIWYHKENPDEIICYDGEIIPPEVEKDPENWWQDEDVLDTWFSSSLWPFSTLGWPQETDDLKKFYPTSLLVTGYDILFFWVARMILMSHFALNTVPFHKTFIHGLIYGRSYWKMEKDGSISYLSIEEKKQYDKGKSLPKGVFTTWEKMSKSKGNIIDPLEIIEQYGADALRFALSSSSSQARQIDLDYRRFEEYKNFTNKLWNGARFIFMHLDGSNEDGSSALTPEEFSKGLSFDLFTLEDRWMLSSMNRTIVLINQYLEGYEFDKAATEAYRFFWNDFCSYYLELLKPYLSGKKKREDIRKNKQKLLVIFLCDFVRLLHPFIPFITEEIFSYLQERYSSANIYKEADLYTQKTISALQTKACMIAPFPQLLSKKDIDIEKEQKFNDIKDLIYAIRNIRGEIQIPLSTKSDVYIFGDASNPFFIFAKENESILFALTQIQTIHWISDRNQIPKKASSLIVHELTLSIPMPQEFYIKEKNRLLKEEEKLTKLRDALKQKIQTKEFFEKAPSHVVEKMTKTIQETEQKLFEIQKKIKSF